MSHNGFGPKPQLPLGTQAEPAALPPAAQPGPNRGSGPAPRLAVAPGSAVPAAPHAPHAPAAQRPPDEPDQDEWVFWPVQSPPAAEHGAAQPAQRVELRPPEEDRPQEEERPRRLRLVRPAEPAADPPADEPEGELAVAESAHWRREQELVAAEVAVQAAREELDWFDQHRMVARSEKAAAEQRLAQAREAQRSSVRALVEARRALDAAEARLWPSGRPTGRDDG